MLFALISLSSSDISWIALHGDPALEQRNYFMCLITSQSLQFLLKAQSNICLLKTNNGTAGV